MSGPTRIWRVRQHRPAGVRRPRRLKEAFAVHLRHVDRECPADGHSRVARRTDNAPWLADDQVQPELAATRHPELKLLPGYSPRLNPIELLR